MTDDEAIKTCEAIETTFGEALALHQVLELAKLGAKINKITNETKLSNLKEWGTTSTCVRDTAGQWLTVIYAFRVTDGVPKNIYATELVIREALTRE